MTASTLLTVLLNYRTADMTLKAAEAALTAMDGIPGEMIILDNDSQDGSFETLAAAVDEKGWSKDNRVRVMAAGHNGGFGTGNNVAIRAGLSDGRAPDYIYLVNSDAFVDPQAIRALIGFMDRTPTAGFAGSKVRGDDGVPHTTHFRFPTIAGEFEQAIRLGLVTRLAKNAVIPLPPSEVAVTADWVAGASMIIRRVALDQIGLFDETYFLYFEETDLCLRAERAGWQTWFVPESTAVHVGSVSTGMKAWSRTPTYWFDSRRYFFLKNHGRLYLTGATLARVVGGALWRLRRLVSHRPLGDPPRFLSDLIAHAFRSTFSGRAPRVPAPYSQGLPSHSLVKDSK